MRQFPTVFSLPPFSSISKALNAFSVNFRDKRTRQNFITITSSIIYSGSPLFSEAAKISSASKNIIKALSHFLISSSWQKAVIDKMRLSLINKLLKDIQFIALDFTAVCKIGKHLGVTPELKKSVITLTGRQRTASLKTIKALRNLADIINNFALIPLIQRNFGQSIADYG